MDNPRHHLYYTWKGIKARCANKTHPEYRNYGGRGISLHPAWVASSRPFRDWVDANLGPKPAGHSLDRIDNDGDYEPGNLRWATPTQQRANQRERIFEGIDNVRAERDLWRERALALGWAE